MNPAKKEIEHSDPAPSHRSYSAPTVHGEPLIQCPDLHAHLVELADARKEEIELFFANLIRSFPENERLQVRIIINKHREALRLQAALFLESKLMMWALLSACHDKKSPSHYKEAQQLYEVVERMSSLATDFVEQPYQLAFIFPVRDRE